MATRTFNSKAPARSVRRLAALSLAAIALGLLVHGGSTARAAWTPGGALRGLGGGRIWQVAFNSANPSFAAAATDNGVYVSGDAGQTWTATPLTKAKVWTVGFDARDPTAMYAGLQDKGIRVSRDSGQTWADASAGLTNRDVRCFGFSTGGIAAGTADGVALSVDGKAWHDGGLGGYGVSALAVAANSPAPVFIAGVDGGDVSKGFLFRSAAGAWQPLSNGLPQTAVVTSVAAGPLTQAVTTRPLLVTTSKGLFRSGDGGTTWTLISSAQGVPDNLFLTTSVFSPLDPSLVYGGADAAGSSGGALLRSTDGGGSFASADQGLPTPAAPGQPIRKEVDSIAVAATTPPTLLAAVNPFDGNAVIYRNVDTAAPSPPALASEPGGATIAPSAGTPRPSVRPSVTPSSSPTPAPGFIGRLTGGPLHFPTPLIFEVLLVGLLVFIYLRWRRHYYVEGPP